MLHKVILGTEPWLSMASDDWKDASPDIDLTVIDVDISRGYNFILPDLTIFSPTEYTFFVAWHYDFLNFQRYELMGEILKRGFKLPSLIHPSSTVSKTSKVGDNTWIHGNTIINSNASVGLNSCILSGSHIMPNALLGKNVWVDQRSTVGHDVVISSNVYIGPNISIKNNIKIGKNCKLERPGYWANSVPDNFFEIRNNDDIQEVRILTY